MLCPAIKAEGGGRREEVSSQREIEHLQSWVAIDAAVRCYLMHGLSLVHYIVLGGHSQCHSQVFPIVRHPRPSAASHTEQFFPHLQTHACMHACMRAHTHTHTHTHTHHSKRKRNSYHSPTLHITHYPGLMQCNVLWQLLADPTGPSVRGE